MLDEKTGALLSAINERCGEGCYKIMEERELLGGFPRGAVDKAALDAMLSHLADGRYIDVRYAEEGVYCVRPLPEGRRYSEEVRRERTERFLRRRDALLCSLFGALAGGFLGSLVFWALSLLL